MDAKKFFPWNILGGFAWAVLFVLLGFFFGQAWQAIEIWSARIGAFLSALFALFVLVYLLTWLVIKKGKQFFEFVHSVIISIKEAITTNQDVKDFVTRHASFFRFAGRRLDRGTFFGLPLTLLIIGFIYILFLFFGIIEDVLTSDPIVAADIRVANLLAVFREAALTKVFLWITLLGRWEIVLSSIVVVSILLWLWKKQIYIIPLWLSTASSELFNFLGKLAFHRARPEVALYIEDSFSFPSGHATIAVSFYGFLTYLLLRSIKSWKSKVNVVFAGIVLILSIGFSRIYLGVHFLSDVWSGYLLGLLWLIIGISISEWLIAKRAVTQTLVSSTVKIKVLSLLLICAELVFYINFALHYNPPIKIKEQYSNEVVVINVLSIFQNNEVPKYTETLIGAPQEPLSFIILAQDDKRLVDVFLRAGWYLADNTSLASVSRLARAALFNEEYLTAPMAPGFWNAQVHDFGFEKPADTRGVRQRHHARFWKTKYKTQDGKSLYVGIASFDSGIKWGIIHRIKPDIDTERETLFADLSNTKLVAEFQKLQFVEPVLGKNFLGDQFFTDGKIYFLILR